MVTTQWAKDTEAHRRKRDESREWEDRDTNRIETHKETDLRGRILTYINKHSQHLDSDLCTVFKLLAFIPCSPHIGHVFHCSAHFHRHLSFCRIYCGNSLHLPEAFNNLRDFTLLLRERQRMGQNNKEAGMAQRTELQYLWLCIAVKCCWFNWSQTQLIAAVRSSQPDLKTTATHPLSLSTHTLTRTQADTHW